MPFPVADLRRLWNRVRNFRQATDRTVTTTIIAQGVRAERQFSQNVECVPKTLSLKGGV